MVKRPEVHSGGGTKVVVRAGAEVTETNDLVDDVEAI